MKAILSIFRTLFRLRRRYFGADFPHYVKDGAKAVKAINVFALLPSVLAMLLAPNHFFRRIPTTYAGGKSAIHLTPIKFFLTAGGLIVVIFYYFEADLRASLDNDIERKKDELFYFYVSTALLSPFYITAVTILVRILLAVINPAVTAFDIMFSGSSGPPFTLGYSSIPLRPSTYRRLSWKRFFFSMCYFAPYSWLATNVLPSMLAYELMALAWITYHVGANDSPIPFVPLLNLIVVTFTVWRVLIYPYLCLLAWAVPAPTDAMLRTDAHDLRWLIDAVRDRKASKANASANQLAFDKGLFEAKAKAISGEVARLARSTRSHVAIDRKYAADFRARREDIYLNWSRLSPLADWVQNSAPADADSRPYDVFQANVTDLKRRLRPDRIDSAEAAQLAAAD